MPYIVKRDGVTLDAQETLQPRKWVARNGHVMPCTLEENPECIVCERTGQLYHPAGWAEPHVPMDTVALEECSRSVYEETVQKLDRGEVTTEQLQAQVEQQQADIDYALALLGEDGEEGEDDEQ